MNKESENLELFKILKDRDVKGKNLLIRVWDMDKNQEGWINAEQFTGLIGEAVEEALKSLTKELLKELLKDKK